MKKTYPLTHPKLKLARIVEAAKYDAKKYIRREKNKTLPSGADFWAFDCKYGPTQEEAEEIHVSQINACMDKAEQQQLPSFYLEIMAKPANRPERPDAEESSDLDDIIADAEQELDKDTE